jgi:hypothetical protein
MPLPGRFVAADEFGDLPLFPNFRALLWRVFNDDLLWQRAAMSPPPVE